MELILPIAAAVLFVYFIWKKRSKKKRNVEIQLADKMDEVSGNEADDEMDIVLLTNPFKARRDRYLKTQ